MSELFFINHKYPLIIVVVKQTLFGVDVTFNKTNEFRLCLPMWFKSLIIFKEGWFTSILPWQISGPLVFLQLSSVLKLLQVSMKVSICEVRLTIVVFCKHNSWTIAVKWSFLPFNIRHSDRRFIIWHYHLWIFADYIQTTQLRRCHLQLHSMVQYLWYNHSVSQLF